MRKTVITICLLVFTLSLLAQTQPYVIDSVEQQLKKATTDRERFPNLVYLCRALTTINPAKAELYGQELLEVAKMTRDKSLIIQAYYANGQRYSFLSGKKDNIRKSVGYYLEGLGVARKYKYDTSIIAGCVLLSEVYRSLPNYDSCMIYCNEANSYLGGVDNDSIGARVQVEYGQVYLARNQKILALRSFLSALQTGEKLKNVWLQRLALANLAGFYMAIEDYDRSIDLQIKSIDFIDQMHTPQSKYLKIQEIIKVGNLYSYNKDFDMANRYYEQALRLADSIRYDPIKPLAYQSIISNYMNAKQPQKALDYFNSHPQLKEFLVNVGFGKIIDQAYGQIYLLLGKYDSAKFYYARVSSFFEQDLNISNKYTYYNQLGILHMRAREFDNALQYFQRAKSIADTLGDLNLHADVSSRLDSIYQLKNDYRQAYVYATLHHRYQDSLNKLGKEKDMMQIEASDEQRRMERIKKEEDDLHRRKNNIQYISIIFGIVILFILLVIMGMFKVSAGFIKAISFFVFLMLFEFIFLVFKKNIYSITKGEPWKDLAFMIALAALLVPLHHWLEHKVLHYLTSHNRLTAAGHHFRNKLFGKKK